MGQWDVYNFLKKNKRKWFFAREIADKLKISPGCVINSCKRLRKARMVEFKHAKMLVEKYGRRAAYVYRFWR